MEDKQMEEQIKDKLKENGNFLLLEEDVWEKASAGEIALEKILLDLPIHQWGQVVGILQSQNEQEAWEQARRHLGMIQTKEDIRYDYFQMNDANQLMRSELDMDYEMLSEIFAYFAVANLSYARKIYSDKAFEGGQELLPDHCRAALEIEKMFACEENDWNGRLECLGKAVKIWQEMGAVVKTYAKLIGEEQTKSEAEAKEAKNELQIMAEQVKQQVNLMVQNGMIEQAKEILAQIRKIMPEDKELQKMEQQLQVK